ncbi:Hypothetical_protein [Hexamita inflata]|uniref:Hypothetical_protein n=1 Tax=Hexamita inflata TaxID=28002 RepID=A0ABP1GUM0_9EUKA
MLIEQQNVKCTPIINIVSLNTFQHPFYDTIFVKLPQSEIQLLFIQFQLEEELLIEKAFPIPIVELNPMIRLQDYDAISRTVQIVEFFNTIFDSQQYPINPPTLIDPEMLLLSIEVFKISELDQVQPNIPPKQSRDFIFPLLILTFQTEQFLDL